VLRHSFLAVFGFLFPFIAKADVDVSIYTTQTGNDVTADVLVNGFTDILSIQFGMEWDAAALHFEAVESFSLNTDPQLPYFGTNSTENGKLFFAWFNPELVGKSQADCSYIFRLRFTSINGQVPPIHISDTLMPIEIMTSQDVFLQLTQNGTCTNLSRISGKVFRDDNANCIKDDGETSTEAWTLRLRRGDEFFQFKTSTAGDFDYICPAGSYELSVVLPTETPVQWTSCQPSINLELVDNQTIVADFGVSQVQNPSGVTSAEVSNFSAVIYPNPVALGQAIPVSIKSEKAQALTLELLDMSGKKLHTSKQEVQAGETKLNLDGQLGSGLYLLKITDENGGSTTAKLTVL
jgi:hypothetical protein